MKKASGIARFSNAYLFKENREMSHTGYVVLRRRGFTLIELLVVIAIIAIIAAILFPVFATAREKARQASCQSNEKQIGIAMLTYAQDFDENLPYGREWGSVSGVANSFTVLLTSYLTKVGNDSTSANQSSVWLCPDDVTPRSYNSKLPQTYAFPSLNTNVQTGTKYDIFLYKWDKNQNNGTNVALAYPLPQVPSPSKTLMLVESPNPVNVLGDNRPYCAGPHMGSTSGNDVTSQDCATTVDTYTCTGVQQPIHGGGWNYLFADGHVKWYRPEATIGQGGTGTWLDGTTFTCSLQYPCGFWPVNQNS
jgi:prepilin-type N-terminal cleavage/methylation domain-containing protein/prepilin-type processing-associated H-X9-DG protein